jgi:hypothetical protein
MGDESWEVWTVRMKSRGGGVTLLGVLKIPRFVVQMMRRRYRDGAMRSCVKENEAEDAWTYMNSLG